MQVLVLNLKFKVLNQIPKTFGFGFLNEKIKQNKSFGLWLSRI